MSVRNDPAGVPVTVTGLVVRGDQRGRHLGFPTANIDFPDGTVLPEEGVYGGHVRLSDGSEHLAAISVGSRPHYYGDGGVVLLEAFLLDFDGDLYGRRAEVVIEVHLRAQASFGSEEELIETMQSDVGRVRAVLRPHRPDQV